MNKQTLSWIVGVFVLFPLFVFLYNKIKVCENDREKCFSNYYKNMGSIDFCEVNIK